MVLRSAIDISGSRCWLVAQKCKQKKMVISMGGGLTWCCSVSSTQWTSWTLNDLTTKPRKLPSQTAIKLKVQTGQGEKRLTPHTSELFKENVEDTVPSR